MARRSLKVALCVACAGLGSVSVAGAAEDVPFERLPAAVQATVQRETRGGEIRDIEREENGGKVSYEVEYIAAGVEYELHIASDGTLLGRKVD